MSAPDFAFPGAPATAAHREGDLHAAGGAGIWDATQPLQTGAMMTTFDDRESAFENKFAHDEELRFKTEARRNKLLGLWAAALLGKSGEAADAFAKEVVMSDFEEAGDEDVYRKVAGDLGAAADEATIRAKMAELMIEAKRQIMNEV